MSVHRFSGHIAGVGTASGTRLVLGAWSASEHGHFADIMVAHPDGTRELLAPDKWVAEFVTATYSFDAVRILPVQLQRSGTRTGSHWQVSAGPLSWEFDVGARTALGVFLAALPSAVARSEAFARLSDPVARRLMPGVSTLGSAGSGRAEWYSARDLHQIDASRAKWEGLNLGGLREVSPPPDFGFSSTPRRPSLTALTSSVRFAQ